MQEFLDKIWYNFSEFWGRLDWVKRIAMVALAAMIVAGTVSIVIWSTKTRFTQLYTNLNGDDLKEIQILLNEEKIPFETGEDGKTISIPEDMVNVFRLKIAKKDVHLSGAVGYEILDKQSFGTTSFIQKVNRQRAQEGELVKSIKMIRGVTRARVHLSVPEESPFVANKKPPSASVVIELDSGVSLTPGEVKGIAQLVASSVDGMRPENVVILDDRGKKLSENYGDPMAEAAANRIALESQMTQKYERQVEEILGRVVGEGKVIAKAALQFDFTESVTTETTYDNENTAVISEVKNTQKANAIRPSPQGVPGARSNLPGEEPQTPNPSTTNNVDKELTTRNLAPSQKVTNSKKPVAGIKNVSVAVMIDGKRIPTIDSKGAVVLDKQGNPVMKYEKWSEADLQSFQSIVMSAIGFEEKRGDKIVIKNMEFAQEDLAAADAVIRERENRELIKNIVKYLAVGITISLFFFLVVRPFVQWVTDNTVESVEDFLPKTLEELEKIQSNQKLPGLEEALPQIEEKLNPEKIEGNLLREKIIALVENNPAKAAQIVHEMIHSVESDKKIA